MDQPTRTLTLNTETYLSQVEDWDISEEEKEEYIRVLWNLMVSAAQIGLGIHPVQQILSTCGNEKASKNGSNLLQSESSVDSVKQAFGHAARERTAKGDPS
ncbi:MAG: hypothetical protein AAGI89_02060 [Pseudomonadota bacterium]